jgi:GDP-L-fucose synthase
LPSVLGSECGPVHASTNLYGPGDNFHPDNSYVIPALMRRFHGAARAGAAEVVVWGSGSPMREFLYVDDMAAAGVHVLQLPPEVYRAHTQPMLSYVNVGTGVDCTIRQLAETVARVVGFSGRLVWDTTKPDGAPRKLLDVSRLAALGWRAISAALVGHKRTFRPAPASTGPIRCRRSISC